MGPSEIHFPPHGHSWPVCTGIAHIELKLYQSLRACVPRNFLVCFVELVHPKDQSLCILPSLLCIPLRIPSSRTMGLWDCRPTVGYMASLGYGEADSRDTLGTTFEVCPQQINLFNSEIHCRGQARCGAAWAKRWRSTGPGLTGGTLGGVWMWLHCVGCVRCSRTHALREDTKRTYPLREAEEAGTGQTHTHTHTHWHTRMSGLCLVGGGGMGGGG